MVDFHYCVQNLSAYNFFVWTFLHFCQKIELSIEFCKSNVTIFVCLHLHFLLALKPKSDETAQKNENCVSISGLRGSILSKKVKIVVH